MIIVISVLVVAVLYGISVYNRLIGLNNVTDESFSGVDVQLKRRHDLIPNLVETVKGYAGHENQTLKDVIGLRNTATSSSNLSIEQKAASEAALSSGIGRLLAIAESYPDLKANQNFQQLQTELSNIEEQIQFARRYYNGAVRDFNTTVQIFPNSIVSSLTGFKKREFFELESQNERNVPKVSFS